MFSIKNPVLRGLGYLACSVALFAAYVHVYMEITDCEFYELLISIALSIELYFACRRGKAFPLGFALLMQAACTIMEIFFFSYRVPAPTELQFMKDVNMIFSVLLLLVVVLPNEERIQAGTWQKGPGD